MKKIIWAIAFSFVLAGCEPVEPVNTALSWTAEEQCQVWNKWTASSFEPSGLYIEVLSGLDLAVSMVQVSGICPDDKMIAVYGPAI